MTSNDQAEKLEDWLDEHVDQYVHVIEDQFRKWFIRGLVAFAIIALSSTVALVGFGYVLKEQQEFSDEIQQQREDATRANCEEQNARNRGTQAALKQGSDRDIALATTPQRKAEIRRSRDVTVTLIDAVMPIQDCDARVEKAVPTKP